MLAYLYDHFLDDYDFFHIAGDDDAFVIIENLKLFLASNQVVKDAGGAGYPKPLFIGEW